MPLAVVRAQHLVDSPAGILLDEADRCQGVVHFSWLAGEEGREDVAIAGSGSAMEALDGGIDAARAKRRFEGIPASLEAGIEVGKRNDGNDHRMGSHPALTVAHGRRRGEAPWNGVGVTQLSVVAPRDFGPTVGCGIELHADRLLHRMPGPSAYDGEGGGTIQRVEAERR